MLKDDKESWALGFSKETIIQLYQTYILAVCISHAWQGVWHMEDAQ